MNNYRKELGRIQRVAISVMLNGDPESRKQALGYELAIIQTKSVKGGTEEYYPREDQTPRQLWRYEVREARWALQGLETLLDAQERNCLGERDKWKPYDGQRSLRLTSRSECSGLSAIMDPSGIKIRM